MKKKNKEPEPGAVPGLFGDIAPAPVPAKAGPLAFSYSDKALAEKLKAHRKAEREKLLVQCPV